MHERLAAIMQQLATTTTEDTFTLFGEPGHSADTQWLVDGLKQRLLEHGHHFEDAANPGVRFVINVIDKDHPQSFRRKAQATFVMSIAEFHEEPSDIVRVGYPLLVRALSNLVMLLVHTPRGIEANFLTLEQGHYRVSHREGHDDEFFDELYERIHPLASSQLVINNIFRTDLERELWEGDEITQQLTLAGQELDAMDLLPAPFPITDLLSEREIRLVKRLYGIGGLSYGNLSARKDATRFWMSASGVNKGNLNVIGQDILMVSGYEPEQHAMVLSVPKKLEPNRVSVDAVEHWMVYREHPGIGAIVHVHAWMDGIDSTEFNYPCGTIQMAGAVADLLREQPDPSCAIIGMKNHGVTITGPNMQSVLERARGRIKPQVPMS
jgi:ribulose-5-phosphate 4-epimerase/fuculose-1-phosphate aldolase